MAKYTFDKFAILRSPTFEFSKEPIDEALITSLCKSPIFREAIYLASPILLEETDKYISDQEQDSKERSKLVDSLAKYYSRMSTRCTPFGLFAGCSVVQWNDKNDITLGKSNRVSRLDMGVICELSRKLTEEFAFETDLFFFLTQVYTVLGRILDI